ncbi:MAG TPA: hypothetical protein H9815_08545 [Candidatus Ruania gallistercoris]|uniref:ATPase BadF/BadG/BcrA/BcrD type domain-containing protein n=1 Tax=Candidatus Ruania gallistercoris TaxID=2838746 RepID=A0A9D2J4Y0_9MICO|nr:hypothetical protein [Candidatus Ruania gallistercoris]
MLRYLGVDAGGTSTRAVLVSADGTCLGLGHAGSGNPVSSGTEHAAAQVLAASLQAVTAARADPGEVTGAVAAMAGARVMGGPAWLNEACRAGGLPVTFRLEADLHATFSSASPEPAGYALVAGTGAIALRVQANEVDQVSDGIGWLLGDVGSGFWIGQQVARAGLAALDGRGPATALSRGLLQQLDLDPDPAGLIEGRSRSVQDAVDVLYSWRPVDLANLAPLAFAVGTDEVAAQIIAEAATALATTLRAVRRAGLAGPVVFGGSVLTRQPAFARRVQALAEGFDDPLFTSDGLVGAASLALRRYGEHVDRQVFDRLTATIAAARAD